MENAFGRVVSVIVMAFAIFIIPVLINLEKVDYIRTIAITTKTVEFVDNVRNHGFIEEKVYDNYKQALSDLGILCKVELERKYQGHFEQDKVWLIDNCYDIENVIYNNGFYDFNIGDYFKVVVYSDKGGDKEVLAYYGGSIRNERA